MIIGWFCKIECNWIPLKQVALDNFRETLGRKYFRETLGRKYGWDIISNTMCITTDECLAFNFKSDKIRLMFLLNTSTEIPM